MLKAGYIKLDDQELESIIGGTYVMTYDLQSTLHNFGMKIKHGAEEIENAAECVYDTAQKIGSSIHENVVKPIQNFFRKFTI